MLARRFARCTSPVQQRVQDSGGAAAVVQCLRQCFVTLSVAVNITAHGCVIGFSAILIPSLRRPESHIHATPSQESWIGEDLQPIQQLIFYFISASVIGFALIMGNFTITPLMDTLGRKRSHILSVLPILTGWFLLLMVNSVGGLIAVRFLQGISMGMLGPLGSVIIGETTDPKSRGAFLTSVSLSLTIGVLSTHGLGALLSWQQNALACSFISFTALLLIIYNPESPSWLVSKGRFKEGEEIFYWLRGRGPDQETEFEKMVAAQKMQRKSSVIGQNLPLHVKVKRFFAYLRSTSRKPEFYKPIIIMFLLYTMFQFSGINILSSYTIDIIHKVVGPDANAKFLMVMLDIERLICNLGAVYFMKTLKRRTLLFSSGAICVFSYIGKSCYVFAKEHNALPFESQWLPIALIALYMCSLTIGISSIPFAVSGEIFPLEYRGLGGGISVLALSFNLFLAVKCFPVLTNNIGLPITYLVYAGVVVSCLTCLYFIMPETKDRTLQEIEDSFRGNLPTDLKSAEPLNGHENSELRRCSSHILY
ncbi:facilitated trehalose transporter Tret1-2 homolog [Melitaea cinxia]|uniref:facilitated trehalose transporter Tret1-2 homolog n=1 Tax=Melitaea cinxia TaxID=113334 RepID=UPI001E272B1B|nr:facilitated trehalose transporter Tret1-2 homolog [Melitaea cinxia]